MTDIWVSQDREGWGFQRDFCRGRIVLGGDRGIFNRLQLRAIASLLGVPEDEQVEFVDAGTLETLAIVV